MLNKSSSVRNSPRRRTKKIGWVRPVRRKIRYEITNRLNRRPCLRLFNIKVGSEKNKINTGMKKMTSGESEKNPRRIGWTGEINKTMEIKAMREKIVKTR